MSQCVRKIIGSLVLFGTFLCVPPSRATDGLHESLSYSVVSPISVQKILPDTYPLPGDHHGTIRVSAARGEYEAASFLVRSSDDSNYRVVVRPSDLTTQDGQSRIHADSLDIRIVKPWFQGIAGWNEINKSGPEDFRQVLIPELLLKDDELVQIDPLTFRNLVRIEKAGKSRYIWVNPPRLASKEQVLPSLSEFPVRDSGELQPFLASSGVTKQIWVTLHVPPDATPGRYKGQINLNSGDASLAVIPLDVDVHAFDLAESPITYSIYYRAQLDPLKASIGSEFRTKEQMRRELEDLRNHGVQSPTMYQSVTSDVLFREALGLRKNADMNHGPLFFLGIQTTETFLGNLATAGEANLRRIFPILASTARDYEFGEIYLYGRDEAKGPELARQRHLWRIVEDLGGRVFVAGSSGAYDLVGDLLDIQVNYGKPDFMQAANWHRSGKRIYSYANPQSGPENPYLFRLNYGVMLWANDYDGAMPYAYQHCFGSCWNDIDHPVYRDHNMTYPTADGVISTLAWEGYREAVDDVRYLYTLERALKQPGLGGSAAARSAGEFLRQLRQDLRAGASRAGKYNQDLQVNLDGIRDRVVGYINQVRQPGLNIPDQL